MSYSFNWDCTLPISNIKDIVSINIVPQTKAYDEGDYLSLRGQVSIDGEYVTDQGNQDNFTEYIPIDITLPNNGRCSDVKTDITNFDYDVKDGNNLFLTLNLTLDGYDWDSPITLIEEDNEVEVKTQAPVLFTKEAAITPAKSEEEEIPSVRPEEAAITPAKSEEEAIPSVRPEEVAITLAKSEEVESIVIPEQKVASVEEKVQEVPSIIANKKEEECELEEVEDEGEDLDYIDFDEVVLDHKEEAIDPSLAEDRKESLTEKIKQYIKKEPVAVTEPIVEENVQETVSTPVVEETVAKEVTKETKKSEPFLETIIEKAKEIVPEAVVEKVVEEVKPAKVIEEVAPIAEVVIEKAAPVVEEVVEKVAEKVKSKPVSPIPMVTKSETVEEQPAVVEEAVLPFPLKTQEIVEEVPAQTKKSDIFDMLYSLDEPAAVVEEEVTPTPVVESVQPQAPIVEQVQPQAPIVDEIVTTQPVQMLEEEVVEEEPTVSTPISTYPSEDSIANQFLDGESILKIIFVQEEETTISNICTKYNVPEKAICNLEQLNSPIRCGDRVMINYGKLR